MSSSDGRLPFGGVPRRALLAGLAAVLAGCGFTPAYGPGGPATKLQGRVRPRDPVDADGFAFNARLAERLGPPAAPVYALDYDLTLAVTPQLRDFDDTTLRHALNGTADFALTETATGRTVAEGRVSAFSSYDSGGTTVAAVAAEEAARARLVVMLADQVVTRLIAALP